jgi:Nucleotidyl transferase AbiEii toxin, Type IV TA system
MNLRPERSVFEEVAELRQILPAFVEKDWFVTQVIAAIAKTYTQGFQIIFTGGTALSKAHGLLERFSEDVDFRVLTDVEPKRAALSTFKHTVVDALRQSGFAINEDRVRARDQNRFFSIDIDYESYFTRADALRPHIQIEMSVRATQLAPIELPVGSFVSIATKTPPEVVKIACIDPVESAADKISALAWRVLDRVRGGAYDDPSIVRHLHDLAILKDRALANPQFSVLAMSAMNADAARPKNKPELIDLSPHEKLARMLSVLHDDKIYEAEYTRFVGGVSYADASRVPKYWDAVSAAERLTRTITMYDA